MREAKSAPEVPTFGDLVAGDVFTIDPDVHLLKIEPLDTLTDPANPASGLVINAVGLQTGGIFMSLADTDPINPAPRAVYKLYP